MDDPVNAGEQSTEEPACPPTLTKRPAVAKSRTVKMSAAKKSAQPTNAHPTKSGKTKRLFPSDTLEDALRVPQAIRHKNNGHPWDTSLVATACGTTPKAEKFFYLAAAARDYGLTVGSRDAAQISLTELGRGLFYAASAEVEHEKKIEAFFKIEKFKQIYDFY